MEDRLDFIFEAFVNKKRRGMIDTLAYRPATISQLANEHKLSLPAMHKHVKILQKAELIQRKKVGRINFLAFDQNAMKQAQDWIMQYNTAWGSNQETLENYIASMERGHEPHGRNVDH